MSNFSGYKTKAFSPSQKFFVLDPNTGSPSFVQGSDLVAQLTPNSNYVYSESTRTTAQATDYAVGALVQTAGSTSAGDNFAAVYLVVAAGEGDFPMDNGNELLVIAGDELLREQLASFDAGDGSDLVAHTGTTETVTEAINQRTIYVGSVAELETFSLAEGVNVYLTEAGRQGSGTIKTGTPPADPEKGFYIVLANGNYWERDEKFPVNPSWFGATLDGVEMDSDALVGLAAHTDHLVLLPGQKLRTDTIPTTLKTMTGGGRLIWDNDAVSIVEYVMPDSFRVDDFEIETIYRNRLRIKANNMKLRGVTEYQSDARTDQTRYTAVEWASDSNIFITEHETHDTGLRALASGTLSAQGLRLHVNHVGEGPDGNAHGVDGIKCSGLAGLNIDGVMCFGTSRDIIDSFIGGGECNISNVWADGYYFNQIEIKSEGTAAADNNITPHDINISNVYSKPGGLGGSANWAGLFIFNQNEGSDLNSPRRINISNYNAREIGLSAAGTYHGAYMVGAFTVNFTNSNLLEAKDYGLTATRCKDIRLTNSNMHGRIRGGNFNETSKLSLTNSSWGYDEETASRSQFGAFIAGTTDELKLTNSKIIGTDRSISAEGATLNKTITASSDLVGQIRVDTFTEFESDGGVWDGQDTPAGTIDVFLTSTTVPSVKLKKVGGVIKNGRRGINQQSMSKIVCMGVDFENLSSPLGGTVDNNNRRIIGCLSDGAGAFPTPAGDDVIVNNIELP